MKIQLNVSLPTDISTSRTTPGQTGATRSIGIDVDSFSQDTVSVSSLSAQTLQMPAVRQDKVNALRANVESGAYDIDPHATASAMLNVG